MRSKPKSYLALVTCCLMTLAMGTLHAWSVLSVDLEQVLGLSRTQSSLVYSLTLVSLTLTVLLAVPLFSRVKPWLLFAIAATMAGLGLLCAASGSIVLMFIGYSGLFGVANGIGYGFALQLSAVAFSHRNGFAMGVTTAAYALGATIGAKLLGSLVGSAGSLTTLRLYGMCFLLLAPLLAVLIRTTGVQYNLESTVQAKQSLDKHLINHYRLCYGLAVFAGLMAIAHAAPFIASFDSSGNAGGALWGAVLLGLGNAVGGVVAGLAADRFSARSIVTVLPAIAGCALAVAAFSPGPNIALGALVIIGFTYGALIAVYPVAIARDFGGGLSATAYGRIFISWGVAGLLAPVLAGSLYDLSENYRFSMLLAMLLSLASLVVASRLKKSNSFSH